MWRTIIFDDGSNPYICKTDKEFDRVSKKYELKKTDTDNFYLATKKGTDNDTISG